MPYIKREDKPRIWEEWPGYSGGPEQVDPPEEGGAFVIVSDIHNAGELNFAITKMVKWYLDNVTGHRYQYYNEVVGVLECAKLEFYRRAVAAYEDEKIIENGDVY